MDASVEAVFQQALAHHNRGDLAAAETGYRAVLAERPVHADTLHLLGVVLHQTGRSELAIAYISGAIRLEPAAPQYHCNFGNVLLDLGRTWEALPCYQTAIRLQPGLADAHHNLGRVLAMLEDKEQAETSFRRALQINSAHTNAQIDLAGLLRETGRAADALALYDAALLARPGDPIASNNRDLALIEMNRWPEAAAMFAEALQHRPDYNTAHFNLGRVLTFQGHRDAAAACFHAVLRHAPDDASAHFGLGELLLLNGEFTQGWPELDVGLRGMQSGDEDHSNVPPITWHGEPTGRGLLAITVDQGIGDAIQHSRYIPLCAERAKIVLVVPKSLARLFSQIPGVNEIAFELPVGSHLHCPITSLPRILQTTLETIPATPRYLHAERALVAAWRDRLASVPGLRVGLAWAGNPGYRVDRRRSIALASLDALAGIPNVSFVSLQTGEAAEQIQHSALPLQDWTNELGDFADTAALIEALDLVISVDTAVVHLAGALGKPVWLLNRFDTDWRWLLNRDDSPWYPSLRQFRQAAPGEWAGVLARVRSELAALAKPAAA